VTDLLLGIALLLIGAPLVMALLKRVRRGR
jgi:hypothetical protein